MERVIYEEVIAEGFQSLAEPIKFKLDRGAGITLIKGTNGVGKTTIFNAIFWAEFGENMKKSVNTWDDKRSDKYRGTRVVIKRVIGRKHYMIARHSNFKGTTMGMKGGDSLMVFEKELDGTKFTKEHLVDAKYKKDSQSLIERHLGINSKVFMNSIMFGQKMQKLIESDNADKRKLFEELFDLVFIDDARERAKEKGEGLKSKLAEIATDIALQEKDIENLIAKLEDIKEQEEAWDSNRLDKIQTLESKIKALKVGDIAATERKISEAEKELKEAESRLKEFENEENIYKAVESKIAKLEADVAQRASLYRRAKTTLGDEIASLKRELLKEAQAVEDKNQMLLKEKETELRKLNNSVQEREDLIATELLSIQKREEAISGILTKCPTCATPVAKETIEEAKNKLRAKNKEASKVVKVLEKELSKLLSTKPSMEKKVKELVKCVESSEKTSSNIKNYTTEDLISKVDLSYITAVDNAKELLEQDEKTLEKCLKELTDLAGNKQLIDTARELCTTKKKELDDNINNKHALLGIVKEREDNLAALKKEEKPDFKTKKETLSSEVKEIQKDCKELLDGQENCEDELARINWWLKTGFASGGIKAYVFESMLRKLNGYCLSYYPKLRFKVEFSVDLSKASKPFTTNVISEGISRDYMDLSGGQKQRVDICIAFAMHDLITSQRDFNILALDEIFEGLDTEGIETAFELIRSKAESHTVFLVTHNDIIDSMNCRTIEMGISDEGYTYIKN